MNKMLLKSTLTGLMVIMSTLAQAQSSTVSADAIPVISPDTNTDTNTDKNTQAPAKTPTEVAPAASTEIAPAAQSSIETMKPTEVAPSKSWSAAISAARSNSLYNFQDGTEEASMDYSASASYQLSQMYKLGALVEYSDDLKTPEKSDFAGGALSLSRSPTPVLKDRVSLVPSMTVGFPVARVQKAASLIGSLGFGLKAVANPDYLFSKKFALAVGITASRNIHTYDTARSGAVTSQYTSTQRLELGWSFSDALSLSAQIVHYNALTYQSTLKEFIMHVQALGYVVNDHWSLALGHQYGGPAFSVWKDNQQDYNFQLTDDSASYAYGQVTYAF